MDDHRPEPPPRGDERATLLGFLDFLRATIEFKLEDLDDEQVRRPSVPPSTMTLLGLVKHLTAVERHWFQYVFLGDDVPPSWDREDPDADWRIEPHETTAGILDAYRAQAEISNGIAREHDLDEPQRRTLHHHDVVRLRWILTHMIEETGRHAGHADLLREAIDGRTGE
ncbi:DinB family protein [Tessaracoccus oleiagri]|uniref:DinB family protein n=1 Tax=Tessaracoccus oleiagri TaxID=686624 RepID=A0A1G9HX20_9ACTN|nr:DinB family protein [Tessaracoccus oleiagri]SDL17375.1 Protein of unknown function [Tessaracoccus oleiagri]